MINGKIVYKILGSLLFIEAALLLLCLGMAFYYNEDDIIAFLISAITTALFGFILKHKGNGADNTMGRRDAYLVVKLVIYPLIRNGNVPNRLNITHESVTTR